jgi:hypothetical protein
MVSESWLGDPLLEKHKVSLNRIYVFTKAVRGPQYKTRESTGRKPRSWDLWNKILILCKVSYKYGFPVYAGYVWLRFTLLCILRQCTYFEPCFSQERGGGRRELKLLKD